MRFLTLAWWCGSLDDAQSKRAMADFEEHRQKIRGRLPPSFWEAPVELPLHDARLLNLRIDVQAKNARLAFIDHGKTKRFTLEYRGLIGAATTADPECGLSGPHGFGDLGYTEEDIVEDGTLEHRLLFSTGIELQIRFRDFAVITTDTSATPSA